MHYAKLYDGFSQQLARVDSVVVQTVAEKYPGRQFNTILDIGCGPGRRTVEFLEEFNPKYGIIAFDISENMIEFARENNGHPKIEYYVADAGGDWTDFLNESQLRSHGIDLVISNYCLHWIADKDAAAKNISDVLAAGGVTCHKMSIHLPFFHQAEAIRDDPKWSEYLRPAPRTTHYSYKNDLWNGAEARDAWCDGWTRCFEMAGFVDVRATVQHCVQALENREQLFALQRSTCFYDKYIPENLRDEFYADYRDLAFPESYFEQRKGAVDFEELFGVLIAQKALNCESERAKAL